jgi:hypothetical protein
MLVLPNSSVGPFWHLLDMPIRWINGGPVEPELQRPFEVLELLILAVIAALIAVVVWDLVASSARERERRELQEQWRRRLHEWSRRKRA